MYLIKVVFYVVLRLFNVNMLFAPLEQFEIFTVVSGFKFLCGENSYYSIFTMSNFFLTLIFFLVLVIVGHIAIFLKNSILPTNWLYLYYLLLIIGNQIIRDLIFHIAGKINYFSLLLFLFLVIAFLNVTGLIPYTFVLTSQFTFTFCMAFIYFFSINLTGIFYHGLKLLNLFYPSGTPIMILPLLILIEFISYFARMFSLAIRLFANITAGHILLKILSWFTYLLFDIFFFGLLGFCLITCLWGLEFFISLLQAYVFLILLCIYLNDVLTLH